MRRAQQLGFEVADVSLQGDRWVACRHGEASSCVVLGSAAVAASSTTTSSTLAVAPGDLLQVHQYGKQVRYLPVSSLTKAGDSLGQVHSVPAVPATGKPSLSFALQPDVQARVSIVGKPAQVIDTLPRYQREAEGLVRTKDYQLVRDYLNAHVSEPFMVIVTVPALCAPCRQMDKMVQDVYAQSSPATLRMKTFILEYFNFADAEREVLGAGAIFPTTLVFEPRTQPRQSIARVIGDLRGASLEEVGRPLRQAITRGAPHTFSRGLLSRDLLQSLRQ